jgi:hypothetical protein
MSTKEQRWAAHDAQMKEQGAREERARIVAWLRERGDNTDEKLARLIEHGDHETK